MSTQSPDAQPLSTAPALPATASAARRLLSVEPGSRKHRALLVLGIAASVLFTATYLIDGLIRSGYSPMRDPISALSLGPGGWLQRANFLVFGVLTCISAAGWRPTLAPGLGTAWYPRLRVLSGLALIGAGLFSQDPGNGFPVGAVAPAVPSLHGQLHNIASYISLIAIIAELGVLAVRLHREPRWRGWAPGAVASAVAMMVMLALFGGAVAHHGTAGVFEKAATIIPMVFGLALTCRLLTTRHLRVTAPDA